jgi:CheY-like chemotaxis protein
MRILIVEDSSAAQEIIIQMLAESPVELELEKDGDEAFRRCFEEGPFDLVLTDEKHPGLSGERLMEEIKKKNPSQDVLLLKKPFRRQHLLDVLAKYTPKVRSRT